MEELKSFLSYAGISFSLAAVLAPMIIGLLYRRGIVAKHVLVKNGVNAEYVKLYQHKNSTPHLGGLIVSIPFLVLVFLLLPTTPLRNVFAFTYFLFAFFGLADELLVQHNIDNKEFRARQETFEWRMGKLAILICVGTVAAVLIGGQLGIEAVKIFGVNVPFTGVFSLVWGFLIVAGTYGAEVTDGIDGLVTGLFLIAYVAYLVIAVLGGHAELIPIIGLLVGAMLVYLYFNIPPARVFMSGVGAIPLGFGLVFLAIMTDTLVPFAIITAVFSAVLFSSASQIIAIRFFHRKIFKIAPLYQHFRAIGWPEPKVVMRFWLAGAVFALIGLGVFAVSNTKTEDTSGSTTQSVPFSIWRDEEKLAEFSRESLIGEGWVEKSIVSDDMMSGRNEFMMLVPPGSHVTCDGVESQAPDGECSRVDVTGKAFMLSLTIEFDIPWLASFQSAQEVYPNEELGKAYRVEVEGMSDYQYTSQIITGARCEDPNQEAEPPCGWVSIGNINASCDAFDPDVCDKIVATLSVHEIDENGNSIAR